ncbi:MAG: hypothetical protein RIA71_13680 [Oceanicaulis sp.]
MTDSTTDSSQEPGPEAGPEPTPEQPGADPRTSPRDQSGDRILAIVNYVLAFLALSNGVTLLIAAILAYVRRDQAEPWLKSHFEFQIATFWYGLVFFIAGFVTLWILGLGLLIWLIGAIWLVIRAAVGLIRLIDGRAHSDPWGFLV